MQLKQIAKQWLSTQNLPHSRPPNRPRIPGSSQYNDDPQIISQFQDTFLYSQSIFILHKNRPKQMKMHLDHKRDKLLWISSRTKAFIIDLQFCFVYYQEKQYFEKMGADVGKYGFGVGLREGEQEIFMLFQGEEERKRYFIMFRVYIDWLKKRDPNYTNYFSVINKVDARYTTEKGNHTHSQKQIYQLSKKIGLNNEIENKLVLQSCMKFHKVANKNDLPLKCIDDYFSIHFCHKDLQPIFQQFSQQKIGNIRSDPQAILKSVMSSQQFRKFLRLHQGESQQKIQLITQKYNKSLSFFDFCRYLYDSGFNSIGQQQQLDQNFPLKDYFCFSSHNTYLSGNQLTSQCKAQRYAEDLDNGVKCVQLDIHNDGNKLKVSHAINGRELCKPVDFQDVIKVIDAFSEKCLQEGISHAPIILSFQNHTNNQNREMILDILTRHFGKALYHVQNNQKIFPTLAYLRGMIIIKTNSKQQQMRSFHKNTLTKMLSAPQSSLQLSNKWTDPAQKFKNPTLQLKYQQFQQFKQQLTHKKFKFNARISKIQQIFIPISSMAKFTTIFKTENGVKSKQSQFCCTSLVNDTITKKSKQEKNQLIQYTSVCWLRTYPHGSQIQSANYNPAPMLQVGAQIIALNTQTKDEYTWMMYRYFCTGPPTNLAHRGYVLKPSHLRNPSMHPNRPPTLFTLSLQLIQTNNFEITLKFRGLAQDMKLNPVVQSGKNSYTAIFTFYNYLQSFIIFDIGEKYRDCVALRWIAKGYRVVEMRNKGNFVDSGGRVIVKVGEIQVKEGNEGKGENEKNGNKVEKGVLDKKANSFN